MFLVYFGLTFDSFFAWIDDCERSFWNVISDHFRLYFAASAIMSTKLTVSNLPNFRKSTLALHRINNMVNGNEMTQSTNHDGFDDLRHFIKAGGEFSKELASTLADRAELEATYAKGLAKLAAKLFKVRFRNIQTLRNPKKNTI